MLTPLKECDVDLPEQLKSILTNANGIKETMDHPQTGEMMDIAWIIYSYEEIKKWSSYYHDEYGISGVVFSDDGAGNPFYLEDGAVYEFDPIDGESTLKADSFEAFFAQPIE